MKEECTYIIIEETSMDYYGFDIFFSIDLYRFLNWNQWLTRRKKSRCTSM